jgi:flagellar hook protein FlgE
MSSTKLAIAVTRFSLAHRTMRRLLAPGLTAIAIVGCGGGDNDPSAPDSLEAPVRGVQQATGRSLDLAIDGDGAFVFADGAGHRVYSRSARLSLDAAGRLVNAQGWTLLGQGADRPGPVVIGDLPLLGLQEIVAAPAVPAPIRLEESLWKDAPVSQGLLRAADLSSYAAAKVEQVRDADGHRVWLGFYFRKLSDTRWQVHLLAFNTLPSDEGITQPIAELDFTPDAAGAVRLPRVTVDVPGAADGMGRATLPMESLQVDFSGVSLRSDSSPTAGIRATGWGIESNYVDTLRLRAVDGYAGLRVSAQGEVTEHDQMLTTGPEISSQRGRVVLARIDRKTGTDARADDSACPQPCGGIRYGQPGSPGFGLLRAGWFETAPVVSQR